MNTFNFSLKRYRQKKIAISKFYFDIIGATTGVFSLFTRVEDGHDTIEMSFCSGNIPKTSLLEEMLNVVFEPWFMTLVSPQLDKLLGFGSCKRQTSQILDFGATC